MSRAPLAKENVHDMLRDHTDRRPRIASIVGVILGGVLADGPGWEWIF